MLGPVLDGREVRLAPPPQNFADLIHSWLSEADIVRHINPYPRTLEESRTRLEKQAASATEV